MKLQIEVKDQWAGVFLAFLRSVAYVERIEEVKTPLDEPAAPEAGTPRLGQTRVYGAWDEPDFDFKEFRRKAWEREV